MFIVSTDQIHQIATSNWLNRGASTKRNTKEMENKWNPSKPVLLIWENQWAAIAPYPCCGSFLFSKVLSSLSHYVQGKWKHRGLPSAWRAAHKRACSSMVTRKGRNIKINLNGIRLSAQSIAIWAACLTVGIECNFAVRIVLFSTPICGISFSPGM